MAPQFDSLIANGQLREAARWIEYEQGLREINRHVPSDAEYFDSLFSATNANGLPKAKNLSQSLA